MPMLARDMQRFTRTYIDAHIGSGTTPASVGSRIRELFGVEVAETLRHGLELRDPHSFLALISPMRRLLLSRMFGAPVTTLRYGTAFVVKRFRRILQPPAGYVTVDISVERDWRYFVGDLVAELSKVFADVDVRYVWSKQRGLKDELKLRGRQVLLLDVSVNNTQSADVQATARMSGNRAASLRVDPAELGSSGLAEWIVTEWIQKQ